METEVSQDDDGLWMKMDSGPGAENTESILLTSGETPRDETVTTPAPTEISRYHSVMDDDGADDVFIPPPPPPPSSGAPWPPAEGSTDPTVNNSSMTLSNGADDVTEAKANPSSLDWHHSEKPLMAAHKADTAWTPEESVDAVSLSHNKKSSAGIDEDPPFIEDTRNVMETCQGPSGKHHQETGDEESSEESEDIVILSEGQKISNTEETKSEDICGCSDRDSKLTKENTDCDNVETQAPVTSGPSDDFEPEDHNCNQNKMDATTSQPQLPEVPTDVTHQYRACDDSGAQNCNLTKIDWAIRESSTSEIRVLQLPMCESTEEMVTKAEQGDGSRKIASDIQQGEQLLQRLQLVQQRQDVFLSESPCTPQQVVGEKRNGKKDVPGTEGGDLTVTEAGLTGGDERVESSIHTVTEGAETNLMEKNESKDTETKARTCFSTVSGQTEHQRISRTEADNTDNDQSGNRLPAEASPINTHEKYKTEIPAASARHRFSAAETSMEKQIQEAAHGKQNLQRARGIFNLADNADVLEIPFKTSISLEPLPPKAVQDQHSDWQFSEQKTQKEISQEIQRELLLVNQGKIPGGYSKGEVRHLKETKLLFEAFQQENMDGPTRHRKPHSSAVKGHVHPSVLERTRSLEMFSLKACSVSRTRSLRLYKCATSEREKSPENLRSMTPTGGSQDKTNKHLSPCKQDQHLRLYRSMDSVSMDVSASPLETGEGNMRQEAPILQQNPFFKLRPSLALQPEVEKDIREARRREEELRRQRRALYGDEQKRPEEETSRFTKKLAPDARQQSRGKLGRVWPPPSNSEQMRRSQMLTEQRVRKLRCGSAGSPV
ncbi:uncharacterized protein LOC113140563 isoform X2 [Mastacembelus armatus]|uniref:uncharacterized protein LOC113140563 isoform X2 n=1 Tax=Mastacembelus armatus TaxID=205130 RepID=UPI000E455409|nr:uncharacterized protein LOC113140563 isoform X2 [Mastacembelus armatus]